MPKANIVGGTLFSQMVNRDNIDERLSRLEQRVANLEDLFAPDLIDEETSTDTNTDSPRSQDARDHLNADDIEQAVIKSPIGEGQDPTACVAKINDIVTFIEGVEEGDVDVNQILDVEIKRVRENCAYGVPADTDSDQT